MSTVCKNGGGLQLAFNYIVSEEFPVRMYATYMYTSWDTFNVTYQNSSCAASVLVIIQANLISLVVWRHSFLIKSIHINATVWIYFI